MKDKKRELGYSYEMIARLAGVSIATVKKIFSGEVKNPRYETLQRLEEAFVRKPEFNVREIPFRYDPEDTSYTYEDYETFPEYASVEQISGKIYPRYPSDKKSDSRFKRMTFDELVRSPRNGSYTFEDYENFPDDIRVEIVRGRIYAMATPTTTHQLIAGEIHYQIMVFIRQKGGGCVPFISPIDVKLLPDSLTAVEPDVIIICDRDKITKKKIEGAPEFVVEVLSPSTAAYDRTVKLDDYRDAGVRELWFVDPEKERILIYDFDHDMTKIYGFQDKVPVGIFDGALEIDFTEIADHLEQIQEN